jgi:hypothetical protein
MKSLERNILKLNRLLKVAEKEQHIANQRFNI